MLSFTNYQLTMKSNPYLGPVVTELDMLEQATLMSTQPKRDITQLRRRIQSVKIANSGKQLAMAKRKFEIKKRTIDKKASPAYLSKQFDSSSPIAQAAL